MANNNICRVCARLELLTVPLFTYKVDKQLLKDIFMSCTSIEVT